MSSKAIRQAQLRSEILGDDANEDDPDAPIPADMPDPEPEPAPVIPAEPVVEAPVAPQAAPAIALTAEQLQSILATVLAQGQAGNAALADAVRESVARARQKIPENEVHDGRSTLNPNGDPRVVPRIAVWHGLIHPSDQKIYPLIPIAGTDDLEQMCSNRELEALNRLRPTDGAVDYEMNDGTTVKVRVVEQLNGAGDPWRLVICWPLGLLSDKHQRNRIGRIPRMVAQLERQEAVSV